MRRAAAALTVAAIWLCTVGARAQELVADLSDHVVAISTDFTGAEVVLFGAVEAPGDVVVVIRGPPQAIVVRRKERAAGLWLNRESMTFAEAPSFYGIAASRPIEEIAGELARERHEIGLDHLRLQPREVDASPAEQAAFREALIRDMQARGVYAAEVGTIAFLGPSLFRTNIAFPANVPTGVYTVQVLLFRNGTVVSAQTTPLTVTQIGFSAQIFRLARTNAAGYGIVAIAVAVLAGWAASAAFRRIA